MARRWTILVGGVALLGCGGALRGPTYILQPTEAPIRYALVEQQAVTIDTPAGPAETVDSTTATVVLSVLSDLSVTAEFESLEYRSEGVTGNRAIEGAELLGQRYVGLARPDGTIEIRLGPDTPAALAAYLDPRSLLAKLHVPLPPPDQGEIDGWPVSSSLTAGTAIELTSEFSGTARFATETTWNGRPMSVIVVQGSLTVEGRGTPAQSPGEVQMSLSGTSTRRYLWDAQNGVMVAVEIADNVSGVASIESLGITLPASAQTKQVAEMIPSPKP